MLLRLLIEGQYREALIFFPSVAAITAICCLLAIRWAVDQFSNESVLFRESERWGFSSWLRHVVRTRGATPSAAEALLCGVLLLLIRFFAGAFVGQPEEWPQFLTTTLITQVALIATPVLLMTLFLTRSPRKTLLLHPPRISALIAAGLLAVVLHPVAFQVSSSIRDKLYPMSDEAIKAIEPVARLVDQTPLFWAVVVFALVPAVCEELAFRGFILSGLRRIGHKGTAIVITAVFFGWLHGLLQQQMNAALVGLVVGYLAVQTGSLWPAVLFHFTHNAMLLVVSRFSAETLDARPALGWLYRVSSEGVVPNWPFVATGAIFAVLIGVWLHRLPYQASPEEKLRTALDHQPSAPMGV
jgi:sodium transport system permease protein